eukprot:scaffold127853_cov18-Tisochrysis_lutea.AAC.1
MVLQTGGGGEVASDDDGITFKWRNLGLLVKAECPRGKGGGGERGKDTGTRKAKAAWAKGLCSNMCLQESDVQKLRTHLRNTKKVSSTAAPFRNCRNVYLPILCKNQPAQTGACVE